MARNQHGAVAAPVIDYRPRIEHLLAARPQLARFKRSRRQGAVRDGENGTVVRACRTIAVEFAQPLTGILAYSEMLVAAAAYTCEAQQREVEGIREGALRLERLLGELRDALTDAAAVADDHRAVDVVEQAMHRPFSRRLAGQEAG